MSDAADRDDLAAIGRQIITDYALDHESLHANWRCEHPDVYAPCGCVDEFLTSFASMVLESDWLREQKAKAIHEVADELDTLAEGVWLTHSKTRAYHIALKHAAELVAARAEGREPRNLPSVGINNHE